MIPAMTEEHKSNEPPRRPDPIDDVREGLGLLFRAAKATFDRIPTKDLEKGVAEGVQEVGKAIGRVVDVIGKELAPKKMGAEDEQVRVADSEVAPSPTEASAKPASPVTPLATEVDVTKTPKE